ncbi:hypothetical protein [Streptomyces sp. CA-106131]|uniref:hypothetical protein n=1 Tax=Streptomyces sp. CA-106131 TaxID=3240045 RepID=UPI003D8D88D1
MSGIAGSAAGRPIGVGNVIGSVVFSVTAKVGIIALAGGALVITPEVFRWHLPALVAINGFAAYALLTGHLRRWHGVVLLVAYWAISFTVFGLVPVDDAPGSDDARRPGTEAPAVPGTPVPDNDDAPAPIALIALPTDSDWKTGVLPDCWSELGHDVVIGHLPAPCHSVGNRCATSNHQQSRVAGGTGVVGGDLRGDGGRGRRGRGPRRGGSSGGRGRCDRRRRVCDPRCGRSIDRIRCAGLYRTAHSRQQYRAAEHTPPQAPHGATVAGVRRPGSSRPPRRCPRRHLAMGREGRLSHGHATGT